MSLLLSYAVPPALALGLSIHGLRRRSLSPGGALAAFFVGSLTLLSPLRTFGVSLIVFYLIGSRATKIGRARKQALESGSGVGEGRRGVAQVLVGAGVGLIAAVGWGAGNAGDRWPFSLGWVRDVARWGLGDAWRGREFGLSVWSPLGERGSRALIYLSLGHYATSLADTLASELGILSPSPPLLITTLRQVPPGTNGGISLTGTLASLLGGLTMGLVYALGIAVESSAARADWAGLGRLVLLGAGAGVVGSGVDSLLGAVLQETVYDERTRRVVTDEAKREKGEKDGDLRVISGWPVLSNIQVNFVSSCLVGVGLAWLAA